MMICVTLNKKNTNILNLNIKNFKNYLKKKNKYSRTRDKVIQKKKWSLYNSWHNFYTTPTFFFKLTIGSIFLHVGPTYPMFDLKKNCQSYTRVVQIEIINVSYLIQKTKITILPLLK
jgi:hypothetical protein